MGIKLSDDDTCLGAALISNSHDMLQVDTSGGKVLEFRRGKYNITSRGGKGFEAVKRTKLVRVLPVAIELVDWDEMEGKTEGKNSNGKAGASQRGLFE